MIPTERTVFADDEYNPDLLNRFERAYLLEHLGETPRQAFDGKQPEELRAGVDIPKGVNPYQAAVLLQRFWEEAQTDAGRLLLDEVRRKTLACDEAQRRGEEQTKNFGGIDYASIGVGCEEGMTKIRRSFVVSLTTKKFAPRNNWISDLSEGPDIEELAAAELRARAIVPYSEGSAEDLSEQPAPNPDAVNIVTLPCPYCMKPFGDAETTKVLKKVHMHVFQGHKDRKDEWMAEHRPKMEEYLNAL